MFLVLWRAPPTNVSGRMLLLPFYVQLVVFSLSPVSIQKKAGCRRVQVVPLPRVVLKQRSSAFIRIKQALDEKLLGGTHKHVCWVLRQRAAIFRGDYSTLAPCATFPLCPVSSLFQERTLRHFVLSTATCPVVQQADVEKHSWPSTQKVDHASTIPNATNLPHIYLFWFAYSI